MEQTQRRNKTNFDRQSPVRNLESGDYVLALMPSHNSKFLARWGGPHKVVQKHPDNNYVVDINGRNAILHINALRRYDTEEPNGQNETDEYHQDEDVPNRAPVDSDQLVPTAVIISADPDDGLNDFKAAADCPAEVRIGEQLTDKQRRQLTDLVTKYNDVFTNKLGCTNVTQHVIKVTDKTCCYQPADRIPEALRGTVQQKLESMERDGVIIRDPQAMWNSPLVIVKKKDGSIRLCNNFIQLNKRTVPEPYIMTNTLELLNRVAGATYLTRLDLKKAYFQVKVHPQSQKYTSFESPFGTWRYAKMPMGLVNAGSTLQPIMDFVLYGAHDYADKLLDDVLVWTNSFEAHLVRLNDVLTRLRSAGLTLNTSKCHLATDRIHIFGFQVDRGLIMPDAENTKAIADWPIPRTKKTTKLLCRPSGILSGAHKQVRRNCVATNPTFGQTQAR